MPLPSLSTCALTARMMTRAPAFSILFSARVTLTKRYWVTSDERRSICDREFIGGALRMRTIEPLFLGDTCVC